jgi:hypothetical protein
LRPTKECTSQAKEDFPIVLGQSWRCGRRDRRYGVSMGRHVYIFARADEPQRAADVVSGAVASILSQIDDTLIFITVAFHGVRPIGELMLGQALAKVVLSIVLVPPLIALLVRLAKSRWLAD